MKKEWLMVAFLLASVVLAVEIGPENPPGDFADPTAILSVSPTTLTFSASETEKAITVTARDPFVYKEVYLCKTPCRNPLDWAKLGEFQGTVRSGNYLDGSSGLTKQFMLNKALLSKRNNFIAVYTCKGIGNCNGKRWVKQKFTVDLGDECTPPCPATKKCDVGTRACVDCLADADCSAGKKCGPTKTCVTCLADADCPTGQRCTANQCVPAVSCIAPPSGLISRWSMDDLGQIGTITTGIALRSVSEHIHRYDGMLNFGQNAAQYRPGKIKEAVFLDGTNYIILVPYRSIWDFGPNEFTLALFANFDLVKGGTKEAFPNTFMAQGTGNNKWVFSYGGGLLNFHMATPTGSVFLGVPFAPIQGRWHHLAVTRSGSTFTFYADGQQIGVATDSRPLPMPKVQLRIGAASSTSLFKGGLDEVDIYNNALSGEQIRDIATTPKCPFADCLDGVSNGGETGRDCGGPCEAGCNVGEGCNTNADCAWEAISQPYCDSATKKCTKKATCSDGIQNQGELGVDCQGPCSAKCPVNTPCTSDVQCTSNYCHPIARQCQVPSCSDSVQNQGELGVDCQGPCTAKCPTGTSCSSDAQCTSNFCHPTERVCKTPTCTDRIKNQNEQGIDCGGPCPAGCGPIYSYVAKDGINSCTAQQTCAARAKKYDGSSFCFPYGNGMARYYDGPKSYSFNVPASGSYRARVNHILWTGGNLPSTNTVTMSLDGRQLYSRSVTISGSEYGKQLCAEVCYDLGSTIPCDPVMLNLGSLAAGTHTLTIAISPYPGYGMTLGLDIIPG
ncbi:hypothetical protein HY639_05080 [Candidatus Woesearchaeota archaeon]|nr:hypothetical protein [Candidatus Woesearchaeota archaeon]